MNLLRYCYFSGWTPENYLSWEAIISEDGKLKQHMNPEYGKKKKKQGAVILEKQLTSVELESLKISLSTFDPAVVSYFKNCPVCIDDVEDITLESEVFPVSLSAPFLTFRHMKKT